MVVYVSVFAGLGLAVLMRGSTRSHARFLLALFVVFTLVGTRVDTGNDYTGYLLRYRGYSEHYEPQQLLTDNERGFSALCLVLARSGLSFHWLIAICAAIFFACLARFSWGQKERLLILSLFFPVVITQLVMSGIRQATALAILLLALNAFNQKRQLAVIGWTIVASQFHSSACVFLPLAFLVGKDEVRPRTLFLSLLIALPLALFLIGDRAETYQTRYLNRAAGEMTSKGAALRLGLLFFSSWIFWRHRKGYRQSCAGVFALLQLFALVPVMLVPMFLVNSVAVHRLIYYALPVHILILGLWPELSTNGKLRQQRRHIALGVYGAYQVAWFTFSRHAAVGYIPYRSFLM